MPHDQAVLDKLVDLVRSVAKIDPEIPVGPATHLVDDLGVDSLDLVGIFLEIQDVFGVVVREEEMTKLQNVGALARYLEESGAARAA